MCGSLLGDSLLVGGFTPGNCMTNASARVKVYFTEKHALVYHPKDEIERVHIGFAGFNSIYLEHRSIGEGVHQKVNNALCKKKDVC